MVFPFTWNYIFTNNFCLLICSKLIRVEFSNLVVLRIEVWASISALILCRVKTFFANLVSQMHSVSIRQCKQSPGCSWFRPRLKILSLVDRISWSNSNWKGISSDPRPLVVKKIKCLDKSKYQYYNFNHLKEFFSLSSMSLRYISQFGR